MAKRAKESSYTPEQYGMIRQFLTGGSTDPEAEVIPVPQTDVYEVSRQMGRAASKGKGGVGAVYAALRNVIPTNAMSGDQLKSLIAEEFDPGILKIIEGLGTDENRRAVIYKYLKGSVQTNKALPRAFLSYLHGAAATGVDAGSSPEDVRMAFISGVRSPRSENLRALSEPEEQEARSMATSIEQNRLKKGLPPREAETVSRAERGITNVQRLEQRAAGEVELKGPGNPEEAGRLRKEKAGLRSGQLDAYKQDVEAIQLALRQGKISDTHANYLIGRANAQSRQGLGSLDKQFSGKIADVDPRNFKFTDTKVKATPKDVKALLRGEEPSEVLLSAIQGNKSLAAAANKVYKKGPTLEKDLQGARSVLKSTGESRKSALETAIRSILGAADAGGTKEITETDLGTELGKLAKGKTKAQKSARLKGLKKSGLVGLMLAAAMLMMGDDDGA